MNPHRHIARHLVEARLIAFLEAAAKAPFPRAPRVLLRGLREGRALPAVLADFSPKPSVDPIGLRVSVRTAQLSPLTFRIALGLFGGHVGDGGTWRVVYTAGGRVRKAVQERWAAA